MLEAYSDNDWGGSLSDRKSTSGVLLHLESSVVSWSSKKQEIVALSTTEAKYIATTSEAYQIFWFRRILQEYGMLINGAIPLWCDNQSAIVVAKNPAHHGRIKHINVLYHFIRGLVTNGVISLHHCSTDHQLADIFTMSFPP